METIIFGKSMDRARAQLVRIFEQMGYIQAGSGHPIQDIANFCRVCVSEYEYKIEFANGDLYYAISARDNFCGIRANRIYIDFLIDKNIIDGCIIPCLGCQTIPEKQIEFFY
jgi:hypothetical protein